MLIPITPFDVYKQRINERIRPFLITSQNGLPPIFITIGEAFVEASNLIEPVIYTPKCIDLVFGGAPFNINTTNGRLVYEPRETTINAYIKDMIFIDCLKMLNYSYSIQVACILEEFAHAFLNIKCEELVKYVVVQLYPQVKYENGFLSPT